MLTEAQRRLLFRLRDMKWHRPRFWWHPYFEESLDCAEADFIEHKVFGFSPRLHFRITPAGREALRDG